MLYYNRDLLAYYEYYSILSCVSAVQFSVKEITIKCYWHVGCYVGFVQVHQVPSKGSTCHLDTHCENTVRSQFTYDHVHCKRGGATTWENLSGSGPQAQLAWLGVPQFPFKIWSTIIPCGVKEASMATISFWWWCEKVSAWPVGPWSLCICKMTHLHIIVLWHAVLAFGYMEGTTFDHAMIMQEQRNLCLYLSFSEIAWLEYGYARISRW